MLSTFCGPPAYCIDSETEDDDVGSARRIACAIGIVPLGAPTPRSVPCRELGMPIISRSLSCDSGSGRPDADTRRPAELLSICAI